MPDNQQPATKQDLAELETRLNAQFLSITQRPERAETALLNGFRTYATQQSARAIALETRLANLEGRLVELELKLGLQPPTA